MSRLKVILTVAAWLLIVGAWMFMFAARVNNEHNVPIGNSTTQVNPSTDGRYHTCGLVTEQGVTEYLETFWARCGKESP